MIAVVVDRNIGQRLVEIKPDVCFNALHGPLGEDGSVQGLLNVLGIRYTHSGVTASSLAMDKQRTKMLVAQLGIRSPDGLLVDEEAFRAACRKTPYVTRPVGDGSSIDTHPVRDPRISPFGRDKWPFAERALMEDMSLGPKLTVTLLGERSLIVTEIVSTSNFYDFAGKYEAGASTLIIPARISTTTLS